MSGSPPLEPTPSTPAISPNDPRSPPTMPALPSPTSLTTSSNAQLATLLTDSFRETEALRHDLAAMRKRAEKAERLLHSFQAVSDSASPNSNGTNAAPAQPQLPQSAVRIITECEERTARAEMARDEANARKERIIDTYKQLDRYLSSVEFHAQDARAGFARIVAEGGGQLVLANIPTPAQFIPMSQSPVMGPPAQTSSSRHARSSNHRSEVFPSLPLPPLPSTGAPPPSRVRPRAGSMDGSASYSGQPPRKKTRSDREDRRERDERGSFGDTCSPQHIHPNPAYSQQNIQIAHDLQFRDLPEHRITPHAHPQQQPQSQSQHLIQTYPTSTSSRHLIQPPAQQFPHMQQQPRVILEPGQNYQSSKHHHRPHHHHHHHRSSRRHASPSGSRSRSRSSSGDSRSEGSIDVDQMLLEATTDDGRNGPSPNAGPGGAGAVNGMGNGASPLMQHADAVGGAGSGGRQHRSHRHGWRGQREGEGLQRAHTLGSTGGGDQMGPGQGHQMYPAPGNHMGAQGQGQHAHGSRHGEDSPPYVNAVPPGQQGGSFRGAQGQQRAGNLVPDGSVGAGGGGGGGGGGAGNGGGQVGGQVQNFQTHVFAPVVTGAPVKKSKFPSGVGSAGSVGGIGTPDAPPPAPPVPAFPATNAQGQRICRQCGMAGRYKDGKCVEKWGPGPMGPGTVCDRCRKKMKRVERRGTLENQQLQASNSMASIGGGGSMQQVQSHRSQSQISLSQNTQASDRTIQRSDTTLIPHNHNGNVPTGPGGTHLTLSHSEHITTSRNSNRDVDRDREGSAVRSGAHGGASTPSGKGSRAPPPSPPSIAVLLEESSGGRGRAGAGSRVQSRSSSKNGRGRAAARPTPPVAATSKRSPLGTGSSSSGGAKGSQHASISPANHMDVDGDVGGDADADADADAEAEAEAEIIRAVEMDSIEVDADAEADADSELLEAVEAAAANSASSGGSAWLKAEEISV